MAFVPGRTTVVIANFTDLSSYLRQVQLSFPVDTKDTTTFGKTARCKTPLLKDGSLSASGFFDSGTLGVGGADEPIMAMRGQSKPWTVGVEGVAIGARVHLMGGVQSDYQPSSAVDDVVSFSLSAVGDGGGDAGVSLHDLTAETTTGNNASVDNGASSANGGVAHLHVTAVTGSATIKVQHSSDNSTFADLVTFTATAAKTSERVEVAAGTTVNRYLRANRAAVGTTVTPVVAFARR